MQSTGIKLCDFEEWKRSALMRRYTRSVVLDGDQVREVKNLGWLFRHWKEVDHFEILTNDTLGRCDSWRGAYMIAHLRDGRRYETPWADRRILKRWLDRPVFRGIRVLYRDRLREATTKHGRCERAGCCVEHEINPNVEACR